MHLVVCIDKEGGMMYNHRRQSRDRIMMEDLAAHLCGRKIVVSPYSEELFLDKGINYSVGDPTLAGEDEYAFIEDVAFPDPENVSELILYNWCTLYPSDRKFDMDISALKRISKQTFAGYSHGKITKEVFKR